MDTLGDDTALFQKVTQLPNANAIYLLTDFAKQAASKRDQPLDV